jgi:hypothetical protein
MKSIFTYPNNSGDHFIDPNYVGSDTEGLQKRVKDMKDGNYKTLTNGSSIGTVDQLMAGLSKFNNNPALEEDSGNNTIYKLWEQPILEGSLELQSGSFKVEGAGTSTKTEYTITCDPAGGGNHGFYEGTKVRLTVDGTAGSTHSRLGIAANLDDTEFYVKKIDANTIQLATDSGLSNILKWYGRESATISSVTATGPAVFTDSGGHDLTVGTEVVLSGANGDIGTSYNGRTFYVNSVAGNDFTLSFDSARNQDLNYQTLQQVNGEKFDFNTSDNNIIVGIDDATRYHDGSRLVIRNLEDLEDVAALGIGVTATTITGTTHDDKTGDHFIVNKNGTKVVFLPNPPSTSSLGVSAHVWDNSSGTISYNTTLAVLAGSAGVQDGSYGGSMDDNADTIILGGPGLSIDDTSINVANVKVYQLSSGSYSLLQTITYQNSGTTKETFGSSIDVSNDGLTMVVGDAYANGSSGKTFVYTRADKASNFTLQTTLLDGGQNVAISGDGLTLVTGNTVQANPTRVYKYAGGSWSLVSTLVASQTGAPTAGRQDYFDLSDDGSVIATVQEYDVASTSLPDFLHYFKYNGSDDYVLTDTVRHTPIGVRPGASSNNATRYVQVSSDGKVVAFMHNIYDILSDNLIHRQGFIDNINASGGGGDLWTTQFGGTGADQEIFTARRLDADESNYAGKFFHIDTNNEKYMMIAWLWQYNGADHSTTRSLHNTLDISSLGIRSQGLFMKYVSTSGGRDFYKLFTNASGQDTITGQTLQTEATFTGDGHLAGKFSSTKDLTFNYPLNIGLPGVATTTGTVLETLPTQGSNIIPVLNIASHSSGGDQGTAQITVSNTETLRYRLASIQLTHGGQGVTFLQQTGASTFVNNAEIKEEFFRAGSQSIDASNFGPWPSGLTVGTNSDGRITGFTGFNSELPGKFFYSDDIMFTPQTVADTYSAPAVSLALQEDVFDMDPEWDTLGYNALKQWPDNVLPQSATVTYNQPNQTSISQGGTKYVRNFGVNRWQVELTYPPMTASDFGVFSSRVQKAKGQFTPFFLNIKKSGTPWLFKFNDLTYSNVRIKEGLSTGGTQVLLEGFATDDVLKEGSLAIAGTMANGNIHTITNQPTANKYGEVKVRFAYATQSTLSIGDLVYMKPDHLVVTLSEDGFEYNVDTTGNYFVTVKFDLDEWKA